MDALILLATKFDADSIPPKGRLSVVARFGVGYDSVDIAACTAAGIAVTITPDGVRRPVATSILSFILALSLKLVQKNRLARLGQEGFAMSFTPMLGEKMGSSGDGGSGSKTSIAAPAMVPACSAAANAA